MAPSIVSSAAPTLKREKSAQACSRAARAAAINSAIFGSRIPDPGSRSTLESLNDSLEQRDERAADALHGGQDLFVDDRVRQHARRRVGNARDAKHLHPHAAP